MKTTFASWGKNLNKPYSKVQMPRGLSGKGGGDGEMLDLQIDRCIILFSKRDSLILTQAGLREFEKVK